LPEINHNNFDKYSGSRKEMRMKVYVDQEGCISCGLCVDVCPEVFSFNEEGLSQPIEGDIPKDCMERAREARDGCPTDVISLEE
jgi:ferredoxin